MFSGKIFNTLLVLTVAGFVTVGFDSPTLPKVPAGVRALIFEPVSSSQPTSSSADLLGLEGRYVKTKTTSEIYLVRQGRRVVAQFLPAGVEVVLVSEIVLEQLPLAK